MFINLAHFLLARWGGKKQGVINGLPQTKSCRNVPPQVGDNCLLVYDSSIRSHVGSVCRQSDTDDAIREPERGSVLEKDEGRMGRITNWDRSNLFGGRVGVVCHDGTYRLSESDEAKAAFVPLTLSSHK